MGTIALWAIQECSGHFSRALRSGNKNKVRKRRKFVLSFCLRSSYLPLTADFPSHWDPDPALTSCCLTMTVMPAFSQLSRPYLNPGNQIPHEPCAETTGNFSLLSASFTASFFQIWKILVPSHDEKATSPCPRGNLASCSVWRRVATSNHWKWQIFFLKKYDQPYGVIFLFCIHHIVNAHCLLNQ